MRRTNCASAATCCSCSQGSRLGRCRCVPMIGQRRPPSRAHTKAGLPSEAMRPTPAASKGRRDSSASEQRPLGAIDLEGIGGLETGEQRPLVRPELRQHDDVGRRGCQISLEAAHVAVGVPGVEREHRQAVRRRARGHLGRSRPGSVPIALPAAHGSSARAPASRAGRSSAPRLRSAAGSLRRGKSTARLAASPKPMRWPVSGAMTSASAVKPLADDEQSAPGWQRPAPAAPAICLHERPPASWGRGTQHSPPHPAIGDLPNGNHEHNPSSKQEPCRRATDRVALAQPARTNLARESRAAR